MRTIAVCVIWLYSFLAFSQANPSAASQGFGKVDQHTQEQARDDISYPPLASKEAPSEGSKFQLPSFNSEIGAIVFYVIVLGLLALVIGIIIKNVRQAPPPVVDRDFLQRKLSKEENIETIDLPEYLQKALEMGDFSLAVRIKYLMMIKALTVKRWISWSKEKTNGEYLRELRDAAFFPTFRSHTILFEQIWYGQQTITSHDYAPISQQFDQFITTLSAHE